MPAIVPRVVGELASAAARAAGAAGLGEFGEAEVEHLGVAVGRHHDVLWFDVAMDDPGVMRRGKRAGDIGRDRQPLGERPALALGEERSERRAVEQFLDDVAGLAVGADVEHRRDMGMVERGRGARLLFEAREPLGIGGESGGQDLDGDVAAEPRVHGLVDLAHAAFAELVLDPIGSEGCPDHLTATMLYAERGAGTDAVGRTELQSARQTSSVD